MEETRNRKFMLGVGSFGLILIASFAYTQIAYDTYAQASSRTTQLQAKMDEFLSVRGKANGVVEALTDKSIHFANPALAIDQRVWNLQMAWADFREESQNPWSGARFLMPPAAALDAAIDQFALSALRNSSALRRGDSPQASLQLTSVIDPQFAEMQRKLADSLENATARRDSAMRGIAYGRSIAYGSFFALALSLIGRLAFFGVRGFKEGLGRRPGETLASPQR